MTTVIHATCPVTGEPLKPGETVNRTAVVHLANLDSDLPSIMASVEATLAGLLTGSSPGPPASPTAAHHSTS